MDTIGLWTLFICLNTLSYSCVNAQLRPKILEHPADAIAAKEEPLTLNCKATGRPQPEISWYHNGTPLVPSERRVILPEGSLFFLRVLHNKREQDAGIYWCEAKSSAGIAVSNNATLQIAILKDEFRSVPLDSLALVGGPVVMNCTPPRGIPEPSVLWYKDGKLLDVSGKRLSMIEDGSLMISEVQSTDAGSYLCSAQNMAGIKNAPTANLKVLTPPRVLRGPTDTEVIEGEGFDIPCELTGDPKPIVAWQRIGHNLPEGRSRTLLDNTLRIEDARAEDQGQYVCTGFNEGGNISLAINLSVFAIPNFTEAPTDVDVQEGDTLNLPCRANGRPKPIIVWDKIYAASSTNIQDELALKHEEELLSKTKIMSLRVKRNVTLSRNMRSLLISDEENASDVADLNALVTENTPFIDVSSTSYPDMPNFQVGNGGELILKDISKKDEGWYACTAINEAGSIVKKIYIHVTAPSDPQVEFQIPNPPGSRWGLNTQNIIVTSIIPVSSSSLDVSWEYAAQPNIFTSKTMTLYYRPVLVNGHDSRILTKEYQNNLCPIEKKIFRLENLKPFMTYEVFSAIPKGLGGYVSNLRRGKTLDGPPTAPPEDVRVGVINNTAAYVRWSPPPSHMINGELTGYKIQIKSNTTQKILGQMVLNASTQSVVINSLSPGGRYTARVAPLTIGGIGPYSPPAPLHMDPSFIAKPPKADAALSSWSSTWMPGVALGILCICLISGAIFAVFWARRSKRNLKASYPAPVMTATLSDKNHKLWLQGHTTLKPTHTYSSQPQHHPPSEYAEVTAINVPKINSSPPEPYATVTLQRNGIRGEAGIINGTLGPSMSMSDDSCRKCSNSPSSSEYNAPIRMPMNICDMLPPPPDHPYGTYKPMQMNNMTIRTNPAALSPQVMRRGLMPMPQPPIPQQMWGMNGGGGQLPPPPPIPNFPQNWERGQTNYHPRHMHHQQPQQNIYSENEYESGSVLYEQFCRENEASYFNEGGEPTEEYYSSHQQPTTRLSRQLPQITTISRTANLKSPQSFSCRNVNMEFFDEQDFDPGTPPPPCPQDSHNKMSTNLRLIAAANSMTNSRQDTNSRRHYRNHHQSRDSSCDRGNGGCPPAGNSSDESESGDNRWVPRTRRSRSRSKSNERRFRGE